MLYEYVCSYAELWRATVGKKPELRYIHTTYIMCFSDVEYDKHTQRDHNAIVAVVVVLRVRVRGTKQK